MGAIVLIEVFYIIKWDAGGGARDHPTQSRQTALRPSKQWLYPFLVHCFVPLLVVPQCPFRLTAPSPQFHWEGSLPSLHFIPTSLRSVPIPFRSSAWPMVE